jgi:hypothetical protein
MNEQARNINALLDKYNDFKQNKKSVENSVDLNNTIDELRDEMERVTSVRDMFTNPYYLNDVNEDKRCSSGKVFGVKENE